MKNCKKQIVAWIMTIALTIGLSILTDINVCAASNDFTINKDGVLTAYSGIGGNVVIPKGVTAIGPKAFAGCSDIQRIEMPNSVIYIDESAFDSCSRMEEIQLSNKLTSIKSCAFWGCASLKRITIPESVKEIGFSAFANCESLNGIYVSQNVTTIGNYALGYMYYGDYIPVIDYIIMGEDSSAAQKYAIKYNIPFITKASVKTKISSLEKKPGNKLVIKWKKNSKVSGYEIQYSTNSKFKKSKTKTVTIKSNSKVSYTVNGLKNGTTYYVRIRGYRTITGKKYYSNWGTIKKI